MVAFALLPFFFTGSVFAGGASSGPRLLAMALTTGFLLAFLGDGGAGGTGTFSMLLALFAGSLAGLTP